MALLQPQQFNEAMPKVWNKRDPNVPPDAIYVGRPTKWGNPFSHVASSHPVMLVQDREEAISMYRGWLDDHPELVHAARQELKGKDLVCWCAPRACHADVLLEIANDDFLW